MKCDLPFKEWWLYGKNINPVFKIYLFDAFVSSIFMIKFKFTDEMKNLYLLIFCVLFEMSLKYENIDEVESLLRSIHAGG